MAAYLEGLLALLAPRYAGWQISAGLRCVDGWLMGSLQQLRLLLEHVQLHHAAVQQLF